MIAGILQIRRRLTFAASFFQAKANDASENFSHLPTDAKVINELQPILSELEMEVTAPKVVQTLNEQELIELVPS